MSTFISIKRAKSETIYGFRTDAVVDYEYTPAHDIELWPGDDAYDPALGEQTDFAPQVGRHVEAELEITFEGIAFSNYGSPQDSGPIYQKTVMRGEQAERVYDVLSKQSFAA